MTELGPTEPQKETKSGKELEQAAKAMFALTFLILTGCNQKQVLDPDTLKLIGSLDMTAICASVASIIAIPALVVGAINVKRIKSGR